MDGLLGLQSHSTQDHRPGRWEAASPTIGWVLPPQHEIRKCPHRNAYRPFSGRQFLSCEFLSAGDPGLCLIDKTKQLEH